MVAFPTTLVAVTWLGLAAATGLSDNPIAADNRIALSGTWQASAPSLPTISGQVNLLDKRSNLPSLTTGVGTRGLDY
jgi:hypothetical protein